MWTQNSIQREPPWTITLELNNSKVAFKIDTGAGVSVLSSKTFENMNPKPELRCSNFRLRSSGGIAKCLGKFSTEVKLDKSSFKMEFCHEQYNTCIVGCQQEKCGHRKGLQIFISLTSDNNEDEKLHFYARFVNALMIDIDSDVCHKITPSD